MDFIGNNQALTLITGPCIIESEQQLDIIAERVAMIAEQLSIPVILKASIDKANRTSVDSFRGLGLEEGLRIFETIKQRYQLPCITDVHETPMVKAVADVVDVIQIPAFLSRQTDLIATAAQTGRPLLIKKGQFMAPGDMKHVLRKARASGAEHIMLCERGSCFGYHNLVVDFRGLEDMKRLGCPVIMDATHAVQLPAAMGDKSGARRSYVPLLARAAVSVGIAGVFMETHPNPAQALSDGPSAVPLTQLQPLVQELLELDHMLKSRTSCVVLEDDR